MAIYKYTTDKVYKRYIPELKGVYFTNDWLLIRDGHCQVSVGYSWNGCSPKIKIFGRIIGTWDGANDEAYYATLWHDVFYQFAKDLMDLGVNREDVDLRFKTDLIDYNFKYPETYYRAVRAFGWITWNFRDRREKGEKGEKDTNLSG